MILPFSSAEIVRTARERAHLSQRDVAARAGTAQSVVARIEMGLTDPGSRTLARLVAAAGLEIACELREPVVADPHVLDDVRRILALTPEQRLDEVRNADRFQVSAHRV